MNDSNITIFYSWQSDLQGNATRYLIQDSIDSTVKVMKSTVEIIADRDTKGESGSPDITQTIFSKIEESDIFIADVSIINKYNSLDDEGNTASATKTAPNPNVMLELGYAAKTLGWENIICIINTDYGSIDDLPFDIKQRRLTPYSLKTKNKTEVKKELTSIIVGTVNKLLESGKRVKGVFSDLVVGSYDLELKKLNKQLAPFDFYESLYYKDAYNRSLGKCRKLIDDISDIELQDLFVDYERGESKIESASSDMKLIEVKGMKLIPTGPPLAGNAKLVIPRCYKVVIREEQKKKIECRVKELFSIDLAENFFALGNLQAEVDFSKGLGSDYIGTEDEKNKKAKIDDLQYELSSIWLLDSYLKTFEGMKFFPLAISNMSTTADKTISIRVKVETNTADVVLPNVYLLNRELEGLEGDIYEEEIVKNTLMMPETMDISYNSDISYNENDRTWKVRASSAALFGIEEREIEYNSDDYESEIQKYVATPITENSGEFKFEIESLRAKETCWLGAGILIRPKGDRVVFSYSIKSQHSSGDLKGTLEYDVSS